MVGDGGFTAIYRYREHLLDIYSSDKCYSIERKYIPHGQYIIYEDDVSLTVCNIIIEPTHMLFVRSITMKLPKTFLRLRKNVYLQVAKFLSLKKR